MWEYTNQSASVKRIFLVESAGHMNQDMALGVCYDCISATHFSGCVLINPERCTEEGNYIMTTRNCIGGIGDQLCLNLLSPLFE